jgi:hypothetical protein
VAISSAPISTDVRIGGGRSAVSLLIGSVAFVAFGVALIAVPHAGVGSKVVGGLTIAFFGPFPLYAGLRLLRSEGIFVLGAEGIRFPLRGWPTLPWSDVSGTRIVVRRGRRYLAVDTPTADARLRQMKSGARGARQNLRHGLGLVSIPEQISPTSLEQLQAQIERRRTAGATAANWAAPANTGTTILPASLTPVHPRGRPAKPGTAQGLRNVAAANGVMVLLALARYHRVSTPRALVVAIGVALLLGALAIHAEAVLTGWVTIVAAEVLLASLDLTEGAHVPVAIRVVDLFFPFCVLFVAAHAWPGRARST